MKKMSNLVLFLCSLCVVVNAPADETAMTIELPPSDLTGARFPFVFRVTLPPDVAEAEGLVTLSPSDGGEADAAPLRAGFSVKGEGGQPRPIAIDPALLAAGEYAGEVSLKAGEREARQAFRLFRMPEGKPDRGIRFGVYAVPFRGLGPERVQAVVERMREHGIDLIQTHMDGVMGAPGPYDRAARLGIEFMPSINTVGLGLAARTDAMRNRFADGSLTRWPEWCLNHPEIRRGAAARLAQVLAEFQRHPGFSGLVYYGDDLKMPNERGQGTVHFACYCDHCRADFERLTGRPPPVCGAVESRTGVVPADDPYLQWMRYRAEDAFGGFVRRMRDAKDGADPAIRMGLIHGWSGQPFIDLASGLYAPVSHGAADAVSSYCYPNHEQARANFIGHYEMARMNNRDKAVWMLGILGMNGTLMHDFVIHQNYWNMLGAGYKLIGYFGWNEIVAREGDAGFAARTPHMDESLAALARVGRHKDWIFPAAAHWRIEPARHAVLFSFTTEAVETCPAYEWTGMGMPHLEAVLAFYREALRQGLPLDVVAEEEVRDGILSKYDALCLHGVKALPDDVHARIESYASAGGTVYVSDSRVAVTNARVCAPETAVAFCRDEAEPAAAVPDRDIAVRAFQADDLNYYVSINNQADRYHGLPFDYGDAEVNYAQARAIRKRHRAVSSVMTFRAKERWLFDLSTGRALGGSDQPYAFTLEPAWGQVIVSLPVPSVAPRIDGPATAVRGETPVWRVRFADPQGGTVAGAYTLKVEIVNPDGRRSPHSGFFSVSGGAIDLPLPIGANDRAGAWSMTVEGGFPRVRETVTVAVAAGEAAQLRLLDGDKIP